MFYVKYPSKDTSLMIDTIRCRNMLEAALIIV